ncbi:hypothetical protein KP509_32G037800 [Ceratopteris richardii]|uniref:mRNA-decapping enzyme-like protein n=1 Tax=Ceratopteris richardii TaxID=49495 RepID=A0A8T2QUM7_CERRI|nr:hypothetical protein KP509_32G037800 [Ceratopteris richardii]
MAQSGRLINQESTWELNRTVLQRIDHHIEDILITAGHVTLYEFDVDAGQWSRKDVEGSLFVVKRRTKPRFQFIVMNRRSTENLVEDLLDDFEYELQVPYLLYRNAAQEVNGIWFYNPRECEEVANLFSRILNAYTKSTPKRLVYSPPQSDEFQELEAVPTPATVDGPLEPQATSSATGVTEDPLERFFSNAMHLSSHNSSSGRSKTIVHPSPVHAPVPSYSPALAMPPPPPPPPSAPLSTSQSGAENGSTKSMESPLKPYFFVPPPLSSSQTTALHPPPLQPSIGAPLLQPFPPPVPSASLTPNPLLSSKPAISKGEFRDALFRLVQNDRFIDMVYEEIMKTQRLSL